MKTYVISSGAPEALTSHLLAQQPKSLPIAELAWIDLLGNPNVVLPDGSQHKLTGKTAALIALIAIEGAPSCQRVAGMLWPESPESLARNNLRTLRHRLTRRLGVELLDNGEQLSISLQAATSQPWNADELAAALIADGVERCTLLADINLLQLEQFQDWLMIARQRVTQQQLSTLDTALSVAMNNGQIAHALDYARACVVLEPLCERWHRQLMHTHMACGDRAAALAAYGACKKILLDNFGVTPDDRTLKLQLSIIGNELCDKPSGTAQLSTVESAVLTRRNLQLERL